MVTTLMSRWCFNNISREDVVGSQTGSIALAFCVVEEMAMLHSLSQTSSSSSLEQSCFTSSYVLMMATVSPTRC